MPKAAASLLALTLCVLGAVLLAGAGFWTSGGALFSLGALWLFGLATDRPCDESRDGDHT